ncbi:hypothetical protein N9Z44_01085 [Mariniblastus sp.]|nr:hypothetical protein [Mariniblastus sp.]
MTIPKAFSSPQHASGRSQRIVSLGAAPRSGPSRLDLTGEYFTLHQTRKVCKRFQLRKLDVFARLRAGFSVSTEPGTGNSEKISNGKKQDF